MQIIGTRANSSFRVYERYFRDKQRFMAAVDPDTGGPCAVVEDYTDKVIPGVHINTDRSSNNYGLIVKNDTGIPA